MIKIGDQFLIKSQFYGDGSKPFSGLCEVIAIHKTGRVKLSGSGLQWTPRKDGSLIYAGQNAFGLQKAVPAADDNMRIWIQQKRYLEAEKMAKGLSGRVSECRSPEILKAIEAIFTEADKS